MTRKFAFIILKDYSYAIMLKQPGLLFTTADPEYLEIIQDNKRCHASTFKNNIQWIQIKFNGKDYKTDNKFLMIEDDFDHSLDYIISSEYSIKDPETVEWLNTFQHMFIGYQPDIYENISQDSFS